MENNIIITLLDEYSRRFQEYSKAATEVKNKIETSKRRIDWHTSRINRLEAQRSKLKYPYWPETVLRPIVNELKSLTPEIEWKLPELLPPLPYQTCIISGKTKIGKEVNITFKLLENKLFYFTGERSVFSSISKNDINTTIIPIETLEILVNYAQSQC